MKRKLCLILSVVMVFSLLSACSSSSKNQPGPKATTTQNDLSALGTLPIVTKPVALTIMTHQGYGFQLVPSNDLKIYGEAGKLLGINIKWETAPGANVKELITTRLAANINLPDLICMSSFTHSDVFNYGKTGVIKEITKDLFAQNAPGLNAYYLKDPAAKIARIDSEGKMWSLPDSIQFRKEFQDGFMLNDRWMKELNLTVPTTTDELYNVLMAFKTKDPNKNGKADEIPLVNLWSTLDFMGDSWDMSLNSGGAFGYTTHDDGTVTCDLTAPKMKDYFTYMNKLYKDGLLDKEFSNTTMDTLAAKVKNNRVGGMIEWILFSNQFDVMVDPAAADFSKVVYPVIKQPKAGPQYKAQRFMRTGTSGDWVITSAAKRPDVAIRFVDAILTNQKMMDLHTYGIEGVTYKVVNGVKKSSISSADFSKMGGMEWALPNCQSGWDESYAGPKEDSDKANNRTILTKEPFPEVAQTADQQAILKKYASDVNTYFQEERAKFITGDEPLSNFDKYVTEIKKRGTEDLLKVYQELYKTAMEAKAKLGK